MKLASKIRQEQLDIHKKKIEQVRPLLVEIRDYAIANQNDTFMMVDSLTDLQKEVLIEYDFDVFDCGDGSYMISWEGVYDHRKMQFYGSLSAASVNDAQIRLRANQEKTQKEYDGIIMAIQAYIMESGYEIAVIKEDISREARSLLHDAGFQVETYYIDPDGKRIDKRYKWNDVCCNEIRFNDVPEMMEFRKECLKMIQEQTDKVIDEIRDFISHSQETHYKLKAYCNPGVIRKLKNDGFGVREIEKTGKYVISW